MRQNRRMKIGSPQNKRTINLPIPVHKEVRKLGLAMDLHDYEVVAVAIDALKRRRREKGRRENHFSPPRRRGAGRFDRTKKQQRSQR